MPAETISGVSHPMSLNLLSKTVKPESFTLVTSERFEGDGFVGEPFQAGWRLQYVEIRTKKAERFLTSRSLNVLKKNEKGPPTEYQRSFSFWKKSSTTGRGYAA